jgi:hypothetical protein
MKVQKYKPTTPDYSIFDIRAGLHDIKRADLF